MPKTAWTALLLFASAWTASTANVILVAGTPSHGPGAHEHNAGILLLEKCLRQNKGLETVVVRNIWPEDESVLEGAHTLVFYMDGGGRNPLIQGDRMAAIGRLMHKGVGLVLLHYTVEVPKEKGGAQLLDWIGGYYERPYSQNPINDCEATRASPAHPISRGWKSFTGKDEYYYRIRFKENDPRVTPILTVMLPKKAPNREVVAWATQREDGGRGFGFTGGHFHTNWGWPDFRRMVVNAILWTAKVDVPRGGARCDLSPDDLKTNLDPKPSPKP
jgi:type 1 glutamine amidotransferase